MSKSRYFPETFSRKFAFHCFNLVIFGAFLVLIGWQWEIRALKSVFSTYVTMKPNTAIGLCCFALAGQIVLTHTKQKFFRFLLIPLAIIGGGLGLFTLIEYVSGANFQIDELFSLDVEAHLTRWPPGRPSPITCINFIFIALSLLVDGFATPRMRKFQQALLLMAWVISFQALIGYFVGVRYSFGSAFFTQMAIHTALLFVILCSGLLLCHSDEGLMVEITGPDIAGTVGRRLLFFAILVPPLVNGLQLCGIRAGFWDQDFGILLRVIGDVVFFSWIAFQTSSRLSDQAKKRKATEERLGLITNAIPAFISYIDKDQYFRFANAAYEPWFGLKPEQIIGRSAEAVLGNSYASAKPYIENALKGEILRFQKKITTPAGEERFFEADYVPEISSDQKINGFVIIGHDVTERTHHAEELAKAVRAKDELLAICSHELRTPVTVMKLSTQIFLRDFKKGSAEMISSERAHSMIAQFDRQLSRLTRLIEEMLDFSRINGGPLPLKRETFDLVDLVSDYVKRTEVQFQTANCRVNFTPSAPITGEWDHFRLEQVIANLLSNSLKYGEGNPISIELSQTESQATFKVADQGLGISKDDQTRIFEPYERAVSVDNISGLGLGLYISNQIVRAHNGQISVASEPGKGSIFSVTLPKKPLAT